MQASATAPDSRIVLKLMMKRSSGYAPGGGSTAPSLQTIYFRGGPDFLPADSTISHLRRRRKHSQIVAALAQPLGGLFRLGRIALGLGMGHAHMGQEHGLR